MVQKGKKDAALIIDDSIFGLPLHSSFDNMPFSM